MAARASRSSPDNQPACDDGHTIFKSHCRACKTLLKSWNTHLKSTGFQDIEQGVFLLNSRLPNDLLTEFTYQSRLSYYRWCVDMASMGKFESNRDRIIWESHADGLSRKKIADQLGDSKTWIVRRIHKIQHSLVNQIVGSVSASQKLFFRGL